MDATVRTRTERLILGSLLNEPARYVPLVKPILNGGEALLGQGHRTVYAACVRLGPAASPSGVLAELSDDEYRGVGGGVALAQMSDAAMAEMPSVERVEHWARAVQTAHIRTNIQSILIGTAQGIAQGHDESEAILTLRSQLDLIAGDRESGRISRDLSLPEFIHFPFPRRPSLLGIGLLTAGGFGVLYGQGGTGKSWLLCQLAVALALGRPWVGIPTHAEGSRPNNVGMISLEMEGYQLVDRMNTVCESTSEGEIPPNIFLHCRDTLRGLIDVSTARDQEDLIGWVRARALDVVIIDPLSRIHCLEETAAELGRIVLPFLDRLRIVTGAAVMLGHHERKSPQGQKGSEDDLEALRGTTRLQSDPTILFRLKRVEAGRMRLTNPKANHGATFEPIYLDRQESGYLVPGIAPPEPERRTEANQKKIIECLWFTKEWMTTAQIAEAVRLTDRTVRNYLGQIEGIETQGHHRSAKYRLTTCLDGLDSSPETGSEPGPIPF